jgi:hypothetical protein
MWCKHDFFWFIVKKPLYEEASTKKPEWLLLFLGQLSIIYLVCAHSFNYLYYYIFYHIVFSISICFPSDSFTVQTSRTSAFIYNYFYFSKRQDAPKVQSLAVATHTSFMEIDVWNKPVWLKIRQSEQLVLPIILKITSFIAFERYVYRRATKFSIT